MKFCMLWVSGMSIHALTEITSLISIGIMSHKVQKGIWKRPKR
jgi:hypothetical protein